MVAVEKLWTDIYYPFYVYKLEAKDCKLYLICLFCILQNKLSYKELYMLLDEGTCLFNFNPNEVCKTSIFTTTKYLNKMKAGKMPGMICGA